MKKLRIVLFIWTFGRFGRAVWGLYEEEYYEKVLKDMQYADTAMLIPMLSIALFMVTEVICFLITTDLAILEIFILKEFSLEA